MSPSKLRSRLDLADYPRLLELALGVIDHPRSTGNDLRKRAIGDSAATNKRDLERLADCGYLKRDKEQRRGKPAAVFSVSSRNAEREIGAARGRQATGRLQAGVRLMPVPTVNLPALRDVLTHPAVAGGTSWVAICEDGAVGAVVAIPTESSAAASVPLIAALQEVGIDPRPFRVEAVLTPDQYADWVRRAGGSARLKPELLAR